MRNNIPNDPHGQPDSPACSREAWLFARAILGKRVPPPKEELDRFAGAIRGEREPISEQELQRFARAIGVKPKITHSDPLPDRKRDLEVAEFARRIRGESSSALPQVSSTIRNVPIGRSLEMSPSGCFRKK
jgi:hypothetical protein